MREPVAHLSRRQRQKAQTAAAVARAASDANRAILGALEGHHGPELERRADALLDAAIAAHATVHDRLTTACRLQAKGGRLAPVIERAAVKDAAEAAFSTDPDFSRRRCA